MGIPASNGSRDFEALTNERRQQVTLSAGTSKSKLKMGVRRAWYGGSRYSKAINKINQINKNKQINQINQINKI